MEISATGDIPITGVSRGEGHFEKANTPINLKALQYELTFYKNEDAHILLEGFTKGFHLHYEGRRRATDAKNLKSIKNLEHVVEEKIEKELKAGRVAGPFTHRPIEKLRISPIGLVPKKSPNEYRLIHHLSYPEGESVNDFIDPKRCSVMYTRFEAAVELVQQFGPNCFLGKSDVQSAFRLLPVHPDDFELLGFQFDNKFYFDKCMPFGCSVSCSTFEKFATFLEFVVKRHCTVGGILHYLDDFLFVGENEVECQTLMTKFEGCFKKLGVPLAPGKSEGPTQCLRFLGLEIDSNAMVVRIPIEKIVEIRQTIQSMLSKAKVTLRQMQSLIGSLNFACRVIIPGRPFCRRLINATCGLTKPYHHLRVTKQVKQDLLMWLEFFNTFNGISVFYDRFWVSNADLELYSDSAAGIGLGFGLVLADSWTYGVWPEKWHRLQLTNDITVLELFPLLVSLYVWGDRLKNKKILFHCDNMSVVHIVNKMSSKSDRVMVLLRHFTLKCLCLNIAVRVKHIEGRTNTLCDHLSRLQLEKFHELAPQAKAEPEVVPEFLWTLFDSEPESCLQ